MAVISISGPDARKFLQGQLTCDLNLLSETHSLRAAHCNLKGRVEALYAISMQGDVIKLHTPDDVAEHAFKHLQPYARFSKVTLDLVLTGEKMDEATRIAEIQSGIARLHPDTVGRFLPQELGLVELGVVDFKKGCYLGQEIVARLHYLGKLKKKFMYQHLHGKTEGLEIVDACGEHALVLI
jgi:folate-binding protein YgfZ